MLQNADKVVGLHPVNMDCMWHVEQLKQSISSRGCSQMFSAAMKR